MKKILLLALILVLLAFPIVASPGPNTYSMDFESASLQYTYAADSTDLSIIGDFSIEAWIKIESVDTLYPNIVHKGDMAVQDDYLFIVHSTIVAGQNRLLCNYFDAAILSTSAHGSTNLALNTWYHVAVTVDVSTQTVIFYVNGVAETTTYLSQSAASINDSTNPLSIGRAKNGVDSERYWDGLLDDVRVYNDIRSAAEILANYQTQQSGSDANMMAYYMLNKKDPKSYPKLPWFK